MEFADQAAYQGCTTTQSMSPMSATAGGPEVEAFLEIDYTPL